MAAFGFGKFLNSVSQHSTRHRRGAGIEEGAKFAVASSPARLLLSDLGAVYIIPPSAGIRRGALHAKGTPPTPCNPRAARARDIPLLIRNYAPEWKSGAYWKEDKYFGSDYILFSRSVITASSMVYAPSDPSFA